MESSQIGKSFDSRNWKTIVASTFMILILLGAVVAGVILVQKEQDIRNKAAKGSTCQQAPDCVLLDGGDAGNSGVYQASSDIKYVEITDQEFHRYEPGDSDDGCRKVSIGGNSVSWERYGSGPDCKDVSNVQIWLVVSTPTPTPSTTSTPTPSVTATPTPSTTSTPTPSASSTATPTASPSTPPITFGCPLTPTGDQILVNFNTTRLRAWDEERGVGGPFTVSVPAGSYKVTLSSSDSHDGSDQTQLKEQYFVQFFAENTLLASTNSISDLPDDKTSLTEVVNSNFSINSGANRVYVRHSAIGETDPHSINAECMLLEPVEVSISAQCHDVKVFDTNWNQISASEYGTLKPGDTIRFSVGGSTTQGTFTKVRFVVNGTTQPESGLFRPGTSELYYDYVIPQGFSQLTVKGELYHSILGWI